MLRSGEGSFSKWRRFLWPVHHYELKKLIPMLLIFFLIYFDYNILRVMKETLVVTAKSSGAEVIPFIKVWVMFPGAILMTLFFTRLSNRFSRENVFYLMLSVFLGYFFLFTFVLYPMRDYLHPHAAADALQAALPAGFKGFVAMFRHWTFTLFYVMSELWSSIISTVLFWGFANQVTRLNEAKRFYGLFGIGANLSGIAAGQISVYLSRSTFNPSLPFGTDAWEQSVVMLVSLVLVAGIAAMVLFRWMHVNILSDPRYYDQTAAHQEEQVKGQLSLRQAFKYLIGSKYLLCLAMIVISYNLVINLVEVLWKHEVNELYPGPSDYNWYMNQVSTVVAVIATLSSLFVSGNSIRKFGWTFTAMLTPAILLITSVGFFTFFFLKEHFGAMVEAFLGMSPLFLVVFFGSAQNIMSRGAKYSVFDATKEMAFVPLSAENKLKGKAAIDGICSRLGKSSGSVVHQGLLILFATFTASAPFVAAVLLGVIGFWMGAVKLLGNRFNELTVQPGTLTPPSDSEEVVGETVSLESGNLKEQQAT
jgi:AAA family ATP:ADP antiporter